MPGKAVAQSSQLGVSTRVRKDGKRKVGNANALAKGLDLTRVGIISDRELDWIIRLALEDDAANAVGDARRAEEERRKAASAARAAGWSDTIGNRHDRFLQSRQQQLEESEARKVALDALYAQQEEEERELVRSRAEAERMREDPRARNVKSMTMLNDAIKAREEQILYNKMKQQQDATDHEQEQLEIQRANWGHEVEEQRKRLEQRMRNVDEKNSNLEIVQFQIEQRRRELAALKDDRAYWAQEAADEEEENRIEKETVRAKERENGLYNKEHSRRAVTKHERLDERIAQHAVDDAEMRRQEEHLDQIKRDTAARMKKKQDEFDGRKQIGLEKYAAEVTPEAHPVYRTQERIAAQEDKNFLSKLYEADAERVQRTRETRLKQGDPDPSTLTHHRRAQATASGYVDKEEERRHLDEMRTYPQKLREEREAEALRKREEALQLEEELKQQAAERREQKRLEVEAAREALRREQEQEEQESAKFRDYIQSQLPEDIHPAIRKKAMIFQ